MIFFWVWLVGVPVTGLLIIFSLGPENFEREVSFGSFLIQLVVILLWALAWPLVLCGFLWCICIGFSNYKA